MSACVRACVLGRQNETLTPVVVSFSQPGEERVKRRRKKPWGWWGGGGGGGA